AVRAATVGAWMAAMRPLCDAVTELLWLARAGGRPSAHTATAGSYQVTFERDNPCHLLRITLPPGTLLFPEISGSHHRCSIRFMHWEDFHPRPVQTTEDVAFQLTVCS